MNPTIGGELMSCLRSEAVFVAVLLLGMICVRAIPSQSEEAGGDGWLINGNRLIQEGRLPEAVELFRKQRQLDPLDPRIYFYSGMALAQMGELSLAAEDLMEAVRLDEANPHYRILYANTLARLGNKEAALEALGAFAGSAAVEALSSTWVWLLSETYNRADDDDSSLRILEILARRHPEKALVDLNRGQIYWIKGDYEKCLAFVESSIEKEPKNNAAAYFYKGKVMQQLGDAEAAKAAYLEAVNQDPENPEYLWKLGSVCLALGEPEEAVVYLEKAESGADQFPEIRYVLGRAYQATKDMKKARETLRHFQTVTKEGRAREYQEIRGAETLGKAEDALEKGDIDQAIPLLHAALEEDPYSWPTHAYLAEILMAQGSLYQALEHLQAMEKIDPNVAAGQYLTARYWYQRRDLRKALEYAQKVKETRPSNPGLRNLLGNIYVGLGRVAEAVGEYEAAVELEPERAEFRLNLEAARKRLVR